MGNIENMDMIKFIVEDKAGERQDLEVPDGISLSLMELLKGAAYPILATCGGMALCATCHVAILENGQQLPPVSDAELDILDTLPSAGPQSRLACQIRVDQRLHNTLVKVLGEEE